jgi:hypothetical protein
VKKISRFFSSKDDYFEKKLSLISEQHQIKRVWKQDKKKHDDPDGCGVPKYKAKSS